MQFIEDLRIRKDNNDSNSKSNNLKLKLEILCKQNISCNETLNTEQECLEEYGDLNDIDIQIEINQNSSNTQNNNSIEKNQN